MRRRLLWATDARIITIREWRNCSDPAAERFRIAMTFHDVRVRRLSDDTSTVSQVIIPVR